MAWSELRGAMAFALTDRTPHAELRDVAIAAINESDMPTAGLVAPQVKSNIFSPCSLLIQAYGSWW